MYETCKEQTGRRMRKSIIPNPQTHIQIIVRLRLNLMVIGNTHSVIQEAANYQKKKQKNDVLFTSEIEVEKCSKLIGRQLMESSKRNSPIKKALILVLAS